MPGVPMWRRYARFFGPDPAADINDELRFHLEAKTQELIAQGVRPADARARAIRQFGNVSEFAEQCERIDRVQARRATWSQSLQQWQYDFRIALRGLVRAPKFSLVVIATLAAGIGGAALMFSMVDSWIVRAVRFPDPARLIYACSMDKARGRDTFISWADYQDLRTRSTGMQSLAAWAADTFTFGNGAAPERVSGAHVTPEMFSVLHISPRMGRVFTAEEVAGGDRHVAVVTTNFWKTRLQSRPLDSGIKVEIDGEPWTVIGVLAADFHFTLLGPAELFAPVFVRPENAGRRDLRTLEIIGRLKPGVSVETASDQMNAIAADIARNFPATNSGIAVYFTSLAHEIGRHTGEQVLLVVLAVTLGLFLIACSNVGNLMLARGLSRRRQAAIQLSVGASAGRLIRQGLLETLLLFSAGAVLGAVIAAGLSPAFAASIPANSLDYLPGHGAVVMNWPVFGAILMLALLSAVLFGIGPAMEASRANVASELKDAATAVSHTRKGKRLRFALVVGQVFLAITLGSATIGLVQSFHKTWSEPVGFEAHGLLTFRLSPEKGRYSDDQRRREFFDAAAAAVVAAWPGSRPTLVESIPFPWDYGSTRFQLDDRPAANPQQLPRAGYNRVDPQFFAAMQIQRLAGRLFEARDGAGPALKAVVNDALAKQYFHDENPIGHRIRISALKDREAEIIGVVPEIQVNNDMRPGTPQIYVPFGQAIPQSAGLIVRAPGGQDPLSAVSAIRRKLAELDPRQPMFEIRTMDDRLHEGFAAFKIIAAMLVFFGGLALTLAALGVYGVVAFSVSQRTKEIGIRAALGAGRPELLLLFLRQGLWLLMLGLVPGLAASFATTRALNGMLSDIASVASGLPTAGSVVVLALSVTAATLLPAWRAATTDPLAAIRHE